MPQPQGADAGFRVDVLRYVVRRLLLGILSVFGVLLITFVGARLSGDVTYLLLAPNATDADIVALHHKLGLDQPIPIQFLVYLGNVVQGDFGDSLKYQVPAMGLVLSRLPMTLQLAIPAFVISYTAGVALGVLAARHRNEPIDRLISSFALFGQAMPGFWLAIMFILVFSVQLGWFPTSGTGDLSHLVMPVTALALVSIAGFMRLTRSSMLTALDSEYIKLARVKGVPESTVVWKHALRNALIPVTTFASLSLAGLIGGTVVIESVFAWPGMGKLMVDAIYSRDYPVVQAGVILTASAFIFLNILVDLLYGYLDPRIRVGAA